jgi:hypothetical protein
MIFLQALRTALHGSNRMCVRSKSGVCAFACIVHAAHENASLCAAAVVRAALRHLKQLA